MKQLFEHAELMQKNAWEIVNDTNVIEIWSSIGATINLVGSLKMGLLINHRDIDFHIYTTPFKLSDSFSAISKLAENKRIKTIDYGNLLEAEDQCIEWHAIYEGKDGHSWQIDMIHILNESPYAGHFEKVAERISAVLTPELRGNILKIKNSIPDEKKVMGIQIYKAVIKDGIQDVDSFWQWKGQNTDEGIITWMP
nr:phosphoglycerate mutase family protein [uncultured Desulfobacter sp.]